MNSTDFNYICIQCKGPVLKNDKYCKNCGAKLDQSVYENTPDSHLDVTSELPDDIILLRFLFILYLLLLGIIYQYLISQYPISILFLSASVGDATALGIIPGIIALVRKIKKKKPTKEIYLVYFIISTFTFFISSNILFPSSFGKNNTLKDDINIMQNEKNNMYKVSFLG